MSTTIEKVKVKPLSQSKNTRNKISAFEKILSQYPGAKFGDMEECPLTHNFAENVKKDGSIEYIYVREIFIPRGMVIVSKIHRHSHPNFLMKGKISVITEGGGTEHLEAPQSIISPAGTKRALVAHEDTIWITIHVTKSKDLKIIEEDVIAKSYNELELETKEITDPSDIKLMR